MKMRKDIPQPLNFPRKPDFESNPPGVEWLMQQQREREKGLVPLRISSTMIVMVAPEKATEAYADYYRKNMLYRKRLKP